MIGMMVRDQHHPHQCEVETGTQGALCRRPATVDEHPRRSADNGDRCSSPIRVRVRCSAAQHDDFNHDHIVPRRRCGHRRHITLCDRPPTTSHLVTDTRTTYQWSERLVTAASASFGRVILCGFQAALDWYPRAELRLGERC
jgi:hypothetical protein